MLTTLIARIIRFARPNVRDGLSAIDPQQVAKRSSSDEDLRLMRLHSQRPAVLALISYFYDAHRIELYRSMCSLYLTPRR
jgi:hypothetical protein